MVVVCRRLLLCDVPASFRPVCGVWRCLDVHIVWNFTVHHAGVDVDPRVPVPISHRLLARTVAEPRPQQALRRRHRLRAAACQRRTVPRSGHLQARVPDVRQQGRYSRISAGNDAALRRRRRGVHRPRRHVCHRSATGRRLEPANDRLRKLNDTYHLCVSMSFSKSVTAIANLSPVIRPTVEFGWLRGTVLVLWPANFPCPVLDLQLTGDQNRPL